MRTVAFEPFVRADRRWVTRAGGAAACGEPFVRSMERKEHPWT
jgi:hypothetical protein